MIVARAERVALLLAEVIFSLRAVLLRQYARGICSATHLTVILLRGFGGGACQVPVGHGVIFRPVPQATPRRRRRLPGARAGSRRPGGGAVRGPRWRGPPRRPAGWRRRWTRSRTRR